MRKTLALLLLVNGCTSAAGMIGQSAPDIDGEADASATASSRPDDDDTTTVVDSGSDTSSPPLEDASSDVSTPLPPDADDPIPEEDASTPPPVDAGSDATTPPPPTDGGSDASAPADAGGPCVENIKVPVTPNWTIWVRYPGGVSVPYYCPSSVEGNSCKYALGNPASGTYTPSTCRVTVPAKCLPCTGNVTQW